MFNFSNAVAALRDAETIMVSTLLTEGEKGQLLGELLATMPPAFNQRYLEISLIALERTYARYRPAEAGSSSGKQDAAPVDAGPGEGPAPTTSGTAERVAEQAENPGGLANASDGAGATSKTAAPAEKPKQAKARK